MKTPDDCKLVFLDVKERLLKLLLWLRNTIVNGGVAMNSWKKLPIIIIIIII
tara:strand:- start:4439 stop:4594 length:156 start_codon:yes stop_codon:yes gene_type:complete